MTTLAAIDIGSNAMRLAIGSVGRNGELTGVENRREAVRLGHDVFSSGIILEETQQRALAALKSFQQAINQFQCDRVRVVATSAMREARNRVQFVNRVAEELGLSIEIIDGAEEAKLVHLAVSRALPLERKTALLIDIGGGSVEITLTKDGDVVFSDSVKMGTVRMLHMFNEKASSPHLFGKLVRKYAHGIHRRLNLELAGESIDLCIGTGGNVESLAELGKRKATGAGHRVLRTEELSDIVEQLLGLSFEERIEKFKLRPDRADVILPAGVVILEILRHVGAQQLLAPGVGLKDGILEDLLPSPGERKVDFHRRQTITFARALGRRYHFDEPHADRVTAHALSLFDQSKKEHGLDRDDRLLLEVAALLHDVGTMISVGSHHKHSYYLIRSSPFVGLSERERELVALVARYHRKALPSDDHEAYQALATKDRERVGKLAAFLRIAEGLEQEHGTGEVTRVKIRWERDRAALTLEGAGELLLERWSASNRSDLFEKIYRRKLIVDKQ